MVEVVTKYLEITDPAKIRPARGSPEIVKVDPPDGAVNRRFYETTGAFELGSRVWVHTCTLDGPHALANYEARGLERYKVAR
jgi:hypothetical protein